MPQMMPMWWAFMIMFITLMISTILSSLYFFYLPSFFTSPTLPLKLSKWDWSW